VEIREEMQKHLKNKSLDHILDGSVLIFFIYYFHKFYSQLAQTYFWSDETLHSYVAGVIYYTKKIPVVLTAVYGTFEWFYPPLFHVLSALVISGAGLPALKYVNLVLLVVFLVGFYVLVRKHYGRYEAGTACVLLSLSSVIAVNTLRYMVEMLSMVLFFFSFFFLLMALRKGENNEKSEMVFAAASGVATGLLLLTKQTGYVVLGFYAMLLVWFLVTGKGRIRTMLAVVGISAAIYGPYGIWAVFCNDFSVYTLITYQPAGALKDTSIAAVKKSFQVMGSPVKTFAYLFYSSNGVILSLSALIPAYHFIKIRARDYPHNYLFLMLIYLATTMVVWGITNPRHTITLLPLLTFLVAYSLSRITSKRVVHAMVILLLLAVSVYSTYSMPNYRLHWNAPPEFRHLAEEIRRDASKGRVLTINHMDVHMYTGKEVVWPHIFTKNPPLDLFKTRDSGEFRRLLKKYDIRYVFIWKSFIGGENFRFRSYPVYMMRNCFALYKQGAMSLMGENRGFVLFKVVDEP
jgi:hypothetical protein